MKPYAAMVVLFLVGMLLGCRSTASGTDPFMRQTMIPPPATGSYSRPGAGAQPYYGSLSPDADTATASVAQAESRPPRLRPVPFHPANGPTTPDDATTRSVVIRRQNDAGSTTSSDVSTAGYTDIAALPEARQGATSGSVRQTSFHNETGAASGSHLVWQSPGDRAQGSAVAPASYEASEGASRYGFADDYHWLRGRLEYSESHKQWKLRYIPIDGMTDTFGGSVVLENGDALSNYQHGDFVEVEGTLGDESEDVKDFAPRYALQNVRTLQ